MKNISGTLQKSKSVNCCSVLTISVQNIHSNGQMAAFLHKKDELINLHESLCAGEEEYFITYQMLPVHIHFWIFCVLKVK